MCQIAHYGCRKDIGTKLRLEQLSRRYKNAMAKELKDEQVQKKLKDMERYTGVAEQPNSPETDDDYSSSEDDEVKFVQIRDIDVHSEVMDVQGELKIAMLEI